MTLQVQGLDSAVYTQLRYYFVRQVEESGNPHLAPYLDTKKIPTIGIGFNLLVHSERIMQKFGIDSFSTNRIEREYAERIKAAINGDYDNDAALNSALNSIMQERFNDDRVPGVKRPGFAFANEAEVKEVFAEIAEEIYEPLLKKRGLTIADSRERAVLFSLAYNAPGLIGKGLIDAIQSGNRAEAWYQIRYGSNAGWDGGVAKRRFEEATLFGLYDDELSRDEACQVFQMLQLHRARIQSVETQFGDRIDDAQADLDAAFEAYNGAPDTPDMEPPTVRDFAAELEIARERFLDDVASEYGVDASVFDAIDTSRIFLDPGRSNHARSIVADHAGLLDSRLFQQNHQIASNDLLIGEGGHDRLIAGAGDDILIGGKGDDILDGSTGDDLYVFAGVSAPPALISEGHDRIRDSDGLGRIQVAGLVLTAETAQAFEHPIFPHRPAWRLTVGDQTFDFILVDGDLVGGGTLWIEGPAVGPGGRITIENFHQGDLGLSFAESLQMQLLPDAPPNPFADADFVPHTSSTTLQEGQARAVTLALSLPALAGQLIRLSVDQLGDALAILVNGATLSLSNGFVDVALEAGQRSLTFSLLSRGNANADIAVTLNAAVLDDQASRSLAAQSSAQASLIVDFDAVEETSSTVADTIYLIDATQPGGGTATGRYGSLYGGITGASHFRSWNVYDVPTSPDLYLSEVIDMTFGAPEEGDDYLTVEAGLGDSYIIGSDYRDALIDGVNLFQLPVLYGNDNDVLLGGGGDDYLETHGGDDQSYGGDGNDFLVDSPFASSAASYDDVSWVNAPGHSNRDRLYGESGNDIIIAGAGDALLDGGTGNDELYGGAGNDTLLGGAGNDVLSGDSRQTGNFMTYFPGVLAVGFSPSAYLVEDVVAPGNDFLDGGDGNDHLLGGGGDDVLMGGEGDDTLQGDTWEIPIDAQGMFSNHGRTPLALHGDDRLYGEGGADNLRGGAGSDLLDGGTGDDYLVGDEVDELAGADYLIGGEGNDTLFGEGGADTLIGGSGNDALYGESSGVGAAAHGDDYLDGGSGDDILMGNGGSDTLLGGDDNDQLYGDQGSTPALQGADYLDGGAGDDILYGGGGADTLIGGSGNDFLVGDFNDTPLALQLNDLLDGGDGDDELQGWGGDDTLIGGAGNDLLFGDAGNDVLDGGDGEDQLQGGDGDDVLIGGLGDTLFGDAGNDTFVVSDGAVIIDNEGENTIIAQLDPSADTWLTALANGDVMIVNTAGQSITLTLATLHAAAALDLGGGGTYDSSTAAIAALYRPRILGNPETDPNFNAVRLGAGVRAADIGLLAFNQDLVLTYSGTQPSWINIADLRSRGALVTVADGAAYGLAPGTQALVLHNWYESQRYSYLGVFRDNAGTLTSFAAQAVDLPRHYSGTELSEILSGTAANDFINAGDGDDVVSAMEGADELSGGLGDDSLFGGSGDDTYIYAVGDGQDVIYEESGSRDVLRFAAGIAPADVLVLQEGEDLILQVGDIAADDSIRIVGWHAAEGRNIERIEFADGTVWSPLDVDAQLPGNHRPRLALPIADQLAPPDESFSFTIPSGAFADPNPGDQLTYSASLADGSALPAWLTFDPATLTFSGTPSDAHGGISRIAITVTDQAGLSTTTEVNVRVPVPVELIGTNGDDTLTAATPDIHSIHGLDGDDILRGSNGEDVLEGGSGSDRLVGGGGSDTYVFEAADFDQPNMDVILGERDSAAESIDVIRFGAGIRPEDVRVSAVHDSAGVDLVLSLSTQASRYFQEITVRNGFSTQFGHEILDQVRFADGTIWDREYLYQVAVLGSERDDWITGFDRDDVIRGYGGVDELNGGGGNDDIAGGAGHDLINGQAGDDTYRFGRGQGVDQITDVSGTNRIVLDAGITPADVTLYRTSSRTSIASPWSASTSDSVVVMLDGGQEQLWLMNFFGGATRPISEIVFADGTIWTSSDIDAHLIDVRGVSNVATGTTGNDEYTVDHPSDGVVNETMAGGLDTLHSSVSYQLGNYFIENLTLTGILDINGIGNENQNTIVGNAGDNFLSGSYLSADAAADTLIGGAGDDVYRVDWHGSLTDNFNDIVIEAAGEGYDTIIAHSYVAIMPAHVESLVLKDNRNYFYYVEYRSVTGNDLDNVIDASSATNFGEGFLIDGGLGADVMIGAYSAAQGAPVRDVRFVVDNVGDVVVGNSDADVVQSSVSYVLAEGLEHLELTGSGAINGTGNSGNNRLEGASNSAANVLTGGQGNDTYRLGAGDSLVELAGEGRDTVILTVAVGSGSIINLASFANVENLTIESNLLAATLIGTDEANDLIGNFWSNSLVGGGGNDLLDGGWGSDSMTGGTGNDTYIVDAAGDVVTELTDEGTDRVSSSISYTLGSALEDLTLTGDALDGTGNALANVIVGNAQVNTLTGLAGNDVLDGRGGADILIGGTGDDIYFVSETTETVIEDAGGGIDLVQSQASFALGDHVENLTLLGYASHGTGNALANVIVGNDSSNRLDGGAGADTLSGGRGHDTYVVDHALDVVIEAADQGIDTVQASVSFVLSAGLENLTLVGGADINGTGNDADNVIIGNTGANTLAGGVGNDTYVIDRSDDLVVEAENAGTDTVQSYVSYTLGATLENLTLLGTAELSATGNAGNNLLIGNSANNLLAGGAGDDTYEVQNTGDVIVEDAGEGNDTVRSSATYALSEHIESLLLTGTESIDGTGNALGNLIVGNDGANLLDGGAGNDRLIGGEGNDTYVIDSVLDVIVELSGEGTDTVRSSVSYTLDSALEHLVLSGSDDLQGTGNTRNNQITGNSGNNVIDGGASSDQMAGADGDDLYLVDSTGDAIVEAEGEGVDSVRSSVSYTLSANVENLTLVGFAAATAIGNALDNVLIGNDSDNQLRGDAGNDVLDGGGGRDTFAGGLGDDIYIVNLTTETITEAVDEGIDLVQSSATFTLSENIENLVLTGSGAINGTGNALENLITGNAANNVLNGGAGNDVMRGGAGNDTYVVESTADVVVENTDEGVDTVQSSITYGLTDTVENLMLTGTANIDAIGNALDNVLTGNTGVNVLSGGAGNDLYRVNNATDAVVEHFGEGIDTVEASVNYTLADNVENLTLTGSGSLSGTGNALNNMLLGNSGANILTGGEGNDVLNGGGGSDQMYGGQGDDLYIVAQTNDTVNELVGQGVDTVESSVTYTLANHVENLTLTGSNAINGTGNSGANTLTGNSAANTLNGSAGADVMIGGGGNDTFIVDDVNDLVVELVEEGTDTVQSAVTYALADHVENLTLTGSAAAHGTGNALNNVLIGNSGINNLYGGDGADSLNGGAGADVLVGGSGDDTYFVDNVGDAVTENVDQGVDTVQSTVSHRLSSNVENLILASSSSINGTGNELNNSITGNNGANVLDGGAGADVLSGGGGNDTYIVDHADDLVVEAASAGTDTVRSSVSFVLAANVEHVILTGSADIDGTGNDLANTLTGNSGANLLAGRGGNDTYIITDTMDVVVEEVDDGIDVVQSSVSFTLGSNVETLTLTGSAAVDGTGNELANVLTGNSAANVLVGGAGNDTLNGGAGADSMSGGLGDDVYVLDNAGDAVTEGVDEGLDTVQSSVTHALAQNVENLTLTGSSSINATGNAAANTLIGNNGANVLDGRAGADSMVGGMGNDTYILDDVGDIVVENAAAGIDTVQVSFSYVLGADIENLMLTGTADIDATGNELANVLTGNSGINTLIGGAGDDTYVIQNAGDLVIELAEAGTDTVQSSLSYSLGNNVENLTLTGAGALNGTGNELDNHLVGNSGANTLIGGAGDDVLDGGTGTDQLIGSSGNDIYVVNTASDVVTEIADEGIDLVQASASYTLGSNVENLTLIGSSSISATGNELSNTLTGNNGANTLNGGAGADTMFGAGGNDTYVVDDAGDVVVESTNGGTDTVQAWLTYALGDNIENLTLMGNANLDATGNDLGNVLTGNGGINVLSGGLGNDTYAIDNLVDTIIEHEDAGIDLIQATISYSLGEHVENLTLMGSSSLSATGNGLDNVLTGNSGANVLLGALGNDTLNGAGGADSMQGGMGDDTYIVDNAADQVIEGAEEGIDLVQSSIAYTLGSHLENLTLTGSRAISGTGNDLDNTLIGNSGANELTGGAGDDVLNGGSGADAMTGGTGNDSYTVDNANDTIIELADEGIDSMTSSLARTLAENIEILFLSGSSHIAGNGNDLANLLRGNSGNNMLTGLGGADILEGAAGNDILVGGEGNTLFNGGSGTDTLTGGLGNELFIGGAGNDTITTDGGADIILFNKGDGQDTIAASTTRDNTISIGGGALYADLLFTKNGDDLVLRIGATDQITLAGYYASESNRSVGTLQMIIEGTSDYDAGSADPTRNGRIESFDFDGLVAAFDAARTADPSLTSWSLTNALLAQHLSGSDSEAMGGDFAYRYGVVGSLADISFTPALAILQNPGFGTTAQSLHAIEALQDSTPRLIA